MFNKLYPAFFVVLFGSCTLPPPAAAKPAAWKSLLPSVLSASAALGSLSAIGASPVKIRRHGGGGGGVRLQQ